MPTAVAARSVTFDFRMPIDEANVATTSPQKTTAKTRSFKWMRRGELPAI
jgi:hypothetical protein